MYRAKSAGRGTYEPFDGPARRLRNGAQDAGAPCGPGTIGEATEP